MKYRISNHLDIIIADIPNELYVTLCKFSFSGITKVIIIADYKISHQYTTAKFMVVIHN